MTKEKLNFESVFYRMKRLDERYMILRRHLAGTDGSYRKIIETANDRISTRALQRLLGDLVGCILEYRDQVDEDDLRSEISEDEMAFYYSYLFLLLGYALERSSENNIRHITPGSWCAISEFDFENCGIRFIDEIEKRGIEDNVEWNMYFSDRDRFVESCKVVRRMYRNKKAHGDLKDEIPAAVILYLHKNGISKWDDESFFTSYAHLDKAIKQSISDRNRSK